MAIVPTLRSRALAATRAFLGQPPTLKDIWGQGFRDFMGIGSGSGSTGVQEYNDQPDDYSRAYSAESYVYTAEQTRLKSTRQVPLKVWQTDKSGKRKAIDHDALAVLDTTNPFGYCAGIPSLLSYTLWSLDFHGRVAWKLAKSRSGRPTEIYWQIPTQYTPLPDPVTFFGGIRVMDINGVRTIPPEELAYFATVNPDDPLKGLSKIKVLKNPLNLRAFSQQNNIDFFENSMRPDWILSGNWANTEDNMARIRRAIRRMLSGANNRAPLILGEGAAAHLLTTSHEDAQWVEQQRLAQEEISGVFGVPLVFLNNLERSTYDNIKTAKLILWHDTMIPELDDLARFMDLQFLWRFWPGSREARITFGFDYDEIEGLGEDLALIWERAMRLFAQVDAQVKNRQLTPNQSRPLYAQVLADLGLDPAPYQGEVPGGETFHENINFVPIDQLSVQALMDVWAMRGQNPEFVESVPGAERASANADAVADRLNKPPEPPSLPPGAPPSLPPPPSGPPSPAPAQPPAEPQKAVDYAQVRRQVADELRQEIQQAVGEAAVQAFGEALKARQPVVDPREQDQLKRRLKRYFQDQKTDVLRTMRHVPKTALPPDLYSRRVYRDRLAELVGDERAAEVERATQAELFAAVHMADDPVRAVVTLYQQAIDVRAEAIATGKAYSPETELRDVEHLHDYGQNNKPVISLDLHRTLTPDVGFPLTAQPFKGVREFLSRMVARGCCVHISTSSIDETDPDIAKARKKQVEAWCDRYGLPVGLVCANSHADVRVDDRGIHVPPAPDWVAIAKTAEAQLLQTYELDENDQYQRRDDLVPVGDQRSSWPKPSSVPADRPRGFSTPIIDIDVHRTLDPAWGTGRIPEPPDPQAALIVRGLYDAGYQIQFSCAGFNPALDIDGGAEDRLAGIVQYLLANDIPYDRVVSKDDYDVRLDDKVIPFRAWAEIPAAIRTALGSAVAKGNAPPFALAAKKPPNQNRPLHDQILLAEEHHAEQIRRPLASSIDAEVVATAWASQYPRRKAAADPDDLSEEASGFTSGLQPNLQDLATILTATYGSGWLVGIASALRQATSRGFPLGPDLGLYRYAASIDWSTWKPGNEQAAQQLAGEQGGAGLAELLQQADVVLQGISNTLLERIAKVLADGARAGGSVDTIARSLREMLDDPSHARTIAQTELARGVSAASLDTYQYNGIPGKSWIAFNPCPLCAQNTGAVVPLNGVFPSGDAMPPAHPHCRCSLVPEQLNRAQVVA